MLKNLLINELLLDKFSTNGLTKWHCILEYQHNSNGYSKSEWQAIQTTTDSVAAQTASPTALQSLSTLGQYNSSIISSDNLRQNYGFARISHPNWPLNDETSLLWIRNLDDSSNLLQIYTYKAVGNSLRIGFTFERMIGGRWDEYGIKPWNWSTAVDFTYFF